MSLKQTLPEEIIRFLAAESVEIDNLLLCTHTDIDNLGTYQHVWLVVDKDQLIVVSGNGAPKLELQLFLKDVSEFRCHGAVGSGLLQARVDGMFVDVLRYTNRLADRFSKVARKLDGALKGEPVVIHQDDAIDPRRCPKCGLMLEFAGDTCPRCVNKGAVLSRMLQLLRPYAMIALGIMCLLVVGIALDLVAPLLTRYLVDDVLQGSPEASQEFQHEPIVLTKHIKMLSKIVAVLAIVQILRMLVNIVVGWLGVRIGTSITRDFRGKLVEHLQKLSVAYYDRQQVGSLVGRVAYDTEALHGFINQITSGFLFQLLLLIGVGAVMFVINVKLAFFTIMSAPLVIIGSLIFWRYIYPRYYKFWDAASKQAGMLSGILSGVRVVKAFRQESRENRRFGGSSDHLTSNRRNVEYAVAVFNPIMGIFVQLGGWIVWYVGGRDVLEGHMTLGELMAYLALLAMFYGPLAMLSQFTNWLTQFVTQAHRIFEILDSPIEITEPKDPQPITPMKGHLRLENVSFGYSRHVPVLRDVDLEIEPGELVGVVGRSGSGKTTIVNLLCRFYDVDEGAVKVDGIDVRNIALDELRSQIGIVLQDPFLFRGSIWDNLTYGKTKASVEEVLEASKAGNCHDFIMNTAHGYDTWVGERGAGLSGGERQRVSISRVLLTDPRVLILDEATSSVDAESEAAIQQALAEVVKGRTTIAIAHRLSTLRRADRIMVIDQGRVSESGTHQELLDRDGTYARLLRIQGQHQVPTVQQLSIEADLGTEADSAAPTNAGLPPLKSHHPRWLTPEIANIHLGNLRALHVTIQNEAIYAGVFAVRCLPVHYPRHYISLRYLDAEKHEVEIGIVQNLDNWPRESQDLISESLLKRYFLHTIVGINAIEVLGGYINFDVETDSGPAQFMMRWQRDRAYDYGDGGKLMIDTDENRYLIPDLQGLSESERRLFMRYIYW
jgi:ATP-binding cassette subfamily B protein